MEWKATLYYLCLNKLYYQFQAQYLGKWAAWWMAELSHLYLMQQIDLIKIKIWTKYKQLNTLLSSYLKSTNSFTDS